MQSMFDAIAPRYDLVNRVMTFRMDVRMAQRTVARRCASDPGSLVADLACGTGDFCRELERQALRPIGFDLSFGHARRRPHRCPARPRPTSCGCPVPDGALDGVTCGFALRNLVELEAFFVELARVVRPGGRIALLEVAEPPNPLLRWGHGIYFGKVVPQIGGLLSDPAAYRYLPEVGGLPARRRA